MNNLNFKQFVEGYLSTIGGIKIIQNPDDLNKHSLSINNKEVGGMHVGTPGGDTRVAKRMFPNLVKDTDKVARIHGIDVDDDLQGFGLGQLLYLRVFDTPGIDWFYNSQTYPPATNTLKTLANKGYIELHWDREPNWNADGGLHLVRITPNGRNAYLTNKFLKQKELKSYWTDKGSNLERRID